MSLKDPTGGAGSPPTHVGGYIGYGIFQLALGEKNGTTFFGDM